jgi:hypothetical protein
MTAMQKCFSIALGLLALSPIPAGAADDLHWNVAADRVDAAVETWTVPELLQRVAAATGWQIFVDPAISNRVSTRFTAKEPGDALRRLLGENNYALVPQTNTPAKLFVFRNSREQATRIIQPLQEAKKKTKSLIGNELVVTLKSGEKIEDLAKKLGAKVVGRADGLNTSRLRFGDDDSAQAARAALEDDSAVESVDSNYYVGRPETPQGLGVAGSPLALYPKASPDGKYTVVGLIDSAVQPKGGNFSDFLLPGVSIAESGSDSAPTHGTTMAETLLRAVAAGSDQKATSVRLLPVDVFQQETAGGMKSSDSTTTYDIAMGIYKAVNGGAMIVNLSLGGEGNSTFLHNTIKTAYDQGVLFIAAAGNEPVKTPTYPAAYPEVVAVTASDRNGNLASYANRGDFVDTIAPGGSIITFGGQQYFVAGTSASTAYASGIAAALAEANRNNGQAVRAALLQALTPKK